MPNIQSAKKRVRKSKRQQKSNNVLRDALKKMVKSLSKLTGKKAKDSFPKTQSILAKAAKKGIIKKKTASRKIGRMAKKMVK